MYRSPTVILADWLGSLDVEELAGVLRRRPEVARSPAPRGLGELAERLEWPGGVAAALQSVPLPAAQLLEVVLAAEPPTRDEVARFLGVAPSDLDGPLAELAGRALVWPDGDELRVVQPLVEGNPHPLGLGFTARELIRRWAGAELGVLAQSLGVPTTGRRAAVLDGIEGWYADPERIRATAARAPAGTAELLDELTWQGPEVAVPGVVFHSLDQRIQGPAGWAVRHGLLIMTNWYAGHMPREVALALRGPDWHPPLDLTPPEVALTRVDPAALEREAVVAAGVAVDRADAVLAGCGRAPVAVLKSGGVGVREVRRLAKTVGVPAADAALWLELGYAAGLLALDDAGLALTPAYDAWCAAEPPDRLVALLDAWWRLGAPAAWPERESPSPALRPDGQGALLVRARQELLRLAAGYPEGHAVADPATLAPALGWALPVVLVGLDPLAEQVTALWREATLLGLVALDGVSAFGRALPAGDREALLATARERLDPPTATAIFQADLTATVPGTPTAALADLLDSCADRESRWPASTWRFSAGSVRRALDTGADADRLTADLAATATGGALPQGLAYLIADAARRHGHVRVRELRCVLRAEDPALLAEVLATRALAHLGLSLLAPTVLGSAEPVDATLAALRAAGYAPVAEDATGAAVLQRAPRRRAGTAAGRASGKPAGKPAKVPPPRTPADLDPRELAKTLLAGAVTDPPAWMSEDLRRVPKDRLTSMDLVAGYADNLPGDQKALLADAVDHDYPVRIRYTSGGGARTERTIEALRLDDDVLIAHCHLRNAERHFVLERITEVSPV